MKLKKYKPVTPSLRIFTSIDKFHIWKGKPIKNLKKNYFSSLGKNNSGKITMAHRQQGTKKAFRDIYENTNRFDIKKSVVTRIEYDPNRSSFLMLNQNEDGKLFYSLCPQNINIGDVIDHTSYLYKSGNRLPLKDIPIGALIYNIELLPNSGPMLVRSAGTFGQLVGHVNENQTLIRLPSGERRLFMKNCLATIGSISNKYWSERNLGKAGKNRLLGRRPHVRGVAMNPIDHPHGGGEGKTGTGRHPVSPTGKLTKGRRTVPLKNKNPCIVKRRYER